MFEFNKIIALYIFTILIVAVWAYNSIAHKKFIFRRTILDTPILIYLGIYTVATLLSIDQRSSLFGYYSRFNGGLISQVCYALLYWAFVSNIKSLNLKSSIMSISLGTIVASILGIGEHFGVYTTCAPIRHSLLFNSGNDPEILKFSNLNLIEKFKYLFLKSCWVQDVQNRVFSTLGQPNWLAALVTAMYPFSIYKLLKNDNFQKGNYKKRLVPQLLNLTVITLLFVTLLFTKSRSGLLAFGVTSLLFWIYIFLKEKKIYIKHFIVVIALTILTYIAFQIPNSKTQATGTAPTGPALESGGTESGVIRKYVWIGAANVFRKYPLFGSGPETFAFSFPSVKPIEHNLTSEWDFVYNKAHNEYLNYLANTGIFGFLAYGYLIVSSILIIYKSSDTILKATILSSYFSILITNFFGFSVVPVSLVFFLLPAFAVASDNTDIQKFSHKLNNKLLRITLLTIILAVLFLIYQTYRYWQADVYYNNARNENKNSNYQQASIEIQKALDISSKESVFLSESAVANSEVALLEAKNNSEDKAQESAAKAVDAAIKAVTLSPRNINAQRILSSTYYKFSMFSKDYQILAEDPLRNSIAISPYDPKLHYQLGILSLKNNNTDEGLINLERSVYLKPNYKEGRYALGLTYIDLQKYTEAISEFEYILKNIDPNDELTIKNLDKAKSALK